MKYLLFVTFIIGVQSQSVLNITQPSNCSIGAVNITKILNFLQENLENIPICDNGFKAAITGDSLTCIEDEVENLINQVTGAAGTEPNEEPGDSTQTVASDCPAGDGCPQNATCNTGSHLITFKENCCCVKNFIYSQPGPIN